MTQEWGNHTNIHYELREIHKGNIKISVLHSQIAEGYDIARP